MGWLCFSLSFPRKRESIFSVFFLSFPHTEESRQILKHGEHASWIPAFAGMTRGKPAPQFTFLSRSFAFFVVAFVFAFFFAVASSFTDS